MDELADDKRAVIITTLTRLPAPGHPAVTKAMVKGNFLDFVLVLRREGEKRLNFDARIRNSIDPT
jgi:hypothetical protein